MTVYKMISKLSDGFIFSTDVTEPISIGSSACIGLRVRKRSSDSGSNVLVIVYRLIAANISQIQLIPVTFV